MWGKAYPHHFKFEMKWSWMEQAGGVKASEGPFKAPLGRGKYKFKGDREVSLNTPALGLIWKRLWGIYVKGMHEGEMTGKSPLSREGSYEGYLSSRLGGDRGAGVSRSADKMTRTNGQGEKDPGERWFRQENSRVEIYILTLLEDNLNSSLLFEHGGGQRASPLWIACILLRCLSWDWLALGWAVEVFAKI